MALLSTSAVTAFAAETADYSTVGVVYGDVDGNGSVTIDDATFGSGSNYYNNNWY